MSLNSCLVLHRDCSESFIDIKVTTPNQLGSLAEETDGEPEHSSLHLPSHLKSRLSGTERSIRVANMEKKLRRTECLENLRWIRTGTSHKSQMLTGKEKNARGEVANTHTQTAITRLTVRIKHATDDYNASYKGLLALGVSQEQALPLQHLKSTDFDGLMSILHGECGLGEGTRKLPWFWSVCTLEPGQESPSEDEELTEAICVEWFRGRERFRRWREEEHWLRREIASTLFEYHSRSQLWEKLSESEYARRTPGYQAYCFRQCDVFFGLLSAGLKIAQEPLQASLPLAICTRAMDMFQNMN